MGSKLGSEIKVREMRLPDLEAVLQLVKKIDSKEDLVSLAREQFIAELNVRSAQNARFVACKGEEVIGTMGGGQGGFPSKLVFWADWLIVKEQFQRCGVAGLLYRTIEAHVATMNKKYICLDMGNLDKERAAYLFHLGNGFQVVGQIPDYWGEFEHLNFMAKRIGG